MKRTIRRGVFETNSSSSHTLTITKKSNYDKLRCNPALFIDKDGNLLTLEDVISEIKSNKVAMETLRNYSELMDPFLDIAAIEATAENCLSVLCYDRLRILVDEYEDMETYTTDAGEEIVAFWYEKEW